MTVVDAHEPSVRNEFCENASVDRRHDRVVSSGHHEGRLGQEGEPGQAAPAECGRKLEAIAIVARPANMTQVASVLMDH